MKPYRELECQQGSLEWLEIRKNHITATDSAKILGKNPWATPLDCYKEKMEDKRIMVTPAMQRGTDLEPKARDLLIAIHGINLKSKVFESTLYPHMMASLDAISDDGMKMWEIKSPGHMTMKRAFEGKIDTQYIIQCQKQMLVMGLDEMSMFYYFNDSIHHEIKIKRDANLIKKIIKADTDFWNDHILPQIPPEKFGVDYERIEDQQATELAGKLKDVIEKEKATKLEKEMLIGLLAEFTKGKNCLFTSAGLKHQIIEKKGNVNWKKVQEKWEIKDEELENYRNKSSKYSKFSNI